jgi:hypothetical protein
MISARPLLSETTISLNRAAVLLNTSRENVVIWTRHGLRGVRLESMRNRLHGRSVTSVEAIGRFLMRVGVKSL